MRGLYANYMAPWPDLGTDNVVHSLREYNEQSMRYNATTPIFVSAMSRESNCQNALGGKIRKPYNLILLNHIHKTRLLLAVLFLQALPNFFFS